MADFLERSNSVIQTTVGLGLRAAKAVARDRGVSDTTIWRWSKRGWIKIVNVCGRPYVDLGSLAEFDKRARDGEFAQAPTGAAGRSSRARAARKATETKGIAA
jgi:hypothetical protein